MRAFAAPFPLRERLDSAPLPLSVASARAPAPRAPGGAPLPRRQHASHSPHSPHSPALPHAQHQHNTHTHSPPAASLTELTERIAGLLHVGRLTDYGGRDLLCPRDRPGERVSDAEGRWGVVVVFGKGLCVGDRVGVEYAKRIVVLVKQIACGGIRVDTLCFSGGRRQGGVVSEAVAGYLFFRQVAEEAGVDVSGIDFVFEEGGREEGRTMAAIIADLKGRYGAESVASWYFTLVSSDYDLIRIQEVHRTCPRRSMLFGLEVEGVGWTSLFAAYPFSVSADATTAFLGRAIVLANDLDIVLVNVRAVLTDRQFLSRENVARLNATSAAMRDMYRVVDKGRDPSSGEDDASTVGASVAGNAGVGSAFAFRGDMHESSEVLETAIGAVREVQRLLSPPGGQTVSRPGLERAELLLARAVHRMRAVMDPDRPLKVADHMDIVRDMEAFVVKHGRQRNGAKKTGLNNFGGGYVASSASVDRGMRVEENDRIAESARRHLSSSSRVGRDAVRTPVAVSSAEPAELPMMTTADIQRGFRMPHPSSPPHSTDVTEVPAVIAAERYFAGDSDVTDSDDDAHKRQGSGLSKKRIARDGPHLILVDEEEPLTESDTEEKTAPVAESVKTPAVRRRPTTRAKKEPEPESDQGVTPRRRRKSPTTTLTSSASPTIGTKRKKASPVTRTTAAKTVKSKVKPARTAARAVATTTVRTRARASSGAA